MDSLLPDVDKEKVRQFNKGYQRCKGLRLVINEKGNFETFWKTPKNIYITGINIKINNEHSHSSEYLNMYVNEDIIFSNIKELNKYRNFTIFRHVAQNEVIKFIYHSNEELEKNIWFDIDYYIDPIKEVE